MLLFWDPSRNIFSQYSKNSFGASKLSSLCKCIYITSLHPGEAVHLGRKNSPMGKPPLIFLLLLLKKHLTKYHSFSLCVLSFLSWGSLQMGWQLSGEHDDVYSLLLCFWKDANWTSHLKAPVNRLHALEFILRSNILFFWWIDCPFLHLSFWWLWHQLKKLKINSSHHPSLLPKH